MYPKLVSTIGMISRDVNRRTGNFFHAILGKFRSFFLTPKFKIKAGYFHRKKVPQFDDTQNKDEYQREVYEKALEIMRRQKLNSIIDIGCGSGYKLATYFDKSQTTGLEISPTLQFLKKNYPLRNWLNAETQDFSELVADLIICADVIEHVKDPDLLLEKITLIRGWKFLLLSTPERDLARGAWTFGPPQNIHHIREWNFKEFYSYVSQYFTIEKQYISNYQQATQVLICVPK